MIAQPEVHLVQVVRAEDYEQLWYDRWRVMQSELAAKRIRSLLKT